VRRPEPVEEPVEELVLRRRDDDGVLAILATLTAYRASR